LADFIFKRFYYSIRLVSEREGWGVKTNFRKFIFKRFNYK
jgi:hypothetical protein